LWVGPNVTLGASLALYALVHVFGWTVPAWPNGHWAFNPLAKSPADKLWPHAFACELDAIEADTLRAMVRNAIEVHLPAKQLTIIKTIEASEREGLMALAEQYADDNDK
jgi:hypothetical protein